MNGPHHSPISQTSDGNALRASHKRFSHDADVGVRGRGSTPAQAFEEIAGYVGEGHVPAHAIQRLLAEKPQAIGLAVPGMPIGSPGMEGGTPEAYERIQFVRKCLQ